MPKLRLILTLRVSSDPIVKFLARIGFNKSTCLFCSLCPRLKIISWKEYTSVPLTHLYSKIFPINFSTTLISTWLKSIYHSQISFFNCYWMIVVSIPQRPGYNRIYHQYLCVFVLLFVSIFGRVLGWIFYFFIRLFVCLFLL